MKLAADKDRFQPSCFQGGLLEHPTGKTVITRNIAMNEFWEARFGAETYAYGKKPNAWFKEQLNGLPPGKILFPAEGEGRNAVYAAARGHESYAFDPSLEGKKKALALADEHKVSITYHSYAYENATYPPGHFDAIVLVFAHMPAGKRRAWHRKLTGFLKPGGLLIIEGFSKEQLQYGTGGPPDIAMLFSEEELLGDFEELEKVVLLKTLTILDEGPFHKGKASVIRGVFKK